MNCRYARSIPSCNVILLPLPLASLPYLHVGTHKLRRGNSKQYQQQPDIMHLQVLDIFLRAQPHHHITLPSPIQFLPCPHSSSCTTDAANCDHRSASTHLLLHVCNGDGQERTDGPEVFCNSSSSLMQCHCPEPPYLNFVSHNPEKSKYHHHV